VSAFTLLQGDCRKVLATLPDESVHCCISSPPYWGLRDYQTAEWEGGDTECDHLGKPHRTRAGFNERYSGIAASENNKQDALTYPMGNVCDKCGARRIDSQLGLEETPVAYVENMVAVFREVRRVLRDDGTLWLNLGDSYVAPNGRSSGGTYGRGPNSQLAHMQDAQEIGVIKTWGDLPAKNLVGIPWRVAFALQADGWWLRQDIIWHKPNPMPESVTDRCTKAHEYIFLLTKSARYYYDNEAVKEKSFTTVNRKTLETDEYKNGKTPSEVVGRAVQRGGKSLAYAYPNGIPFRNKRSVWTVTTKPFKGAHFATFPPDLIEPCVLAGTSHFGACAECKTPYQRLVEKGDVPKRKTRDNLLGVYPGRKTTTRLNSVDMAVIPTETTGWGKTCNCTTDAVEPCVVLDPFSGAGTTGVVAIKHSRCYIGTELNPDYLEISRKRIQAEWDGITLPMF